MKNDFEDFNDYDDNYNEFSNSFTPQNLDHSTFKQRNDPAPIIQRYRLQLMNAYTIEENITDKETGEVKTVTKIRFIKGTNPKANKQGIEDIISYLEKIINSHTVQGNIINMTEYNHKMISISQDITKHFIENRVNWGITLSDCDVMISNFINLIDLILTRPLENEERKGYGETYKDTTTREVRAQDKPNIFQRVGTWFGGNR